MRKLTIIRPGQSLSIGILALVLLFSAPPAKAYNQDSCAFLGEIRATAAEFAPIGWALCWGQLLNINYNIELYSVIGNTFGGDGITTFALPDLRGRVAVGAGQGSGLTNRTLGINFGAEQAVVNNKHEGQQLTVAPAPTGHQGNSLETIPPVSLINYIISVQGVYPDPWD